MKAEQSGFEIERKEKNKLQGRSENNDMNMPASSNLKKKITEIN